MCGLAGAIVVKAEANIDDFIRSSFVANSLRGMDSSGIGLIYTESDTIDSHKLPLNGSYFITDSYASSLIGGTGKANTISICHTRHATTGGINKNTAHPFECYTKDEDRVILGAHNGTLNSWKHRKGATKFVVDSEWALNHILAEGADAFEDFYGAYCFVWWDSKTPGQLNMARNKERPMHVVMLKSGGMAYASEAGMLYWLLERHNVAMDGPIMELDVDTLYQFPVDNPANFSKSHLPAATTYTYPSNTYKNTVDRVKELFQATGAVAASTAMVPVTPIRSAIPKSAMVSDAEYNAAKDLNVLGTRVDFSPYNLWHGTVEGTVYMHDNSMAAEVRNAGHISYEYQDMWCCTIIGVSDDGNEVTLILGPPAASDITKNTQIALQ
jgi:asparagine synthetase B (glutamine-hydrolysing)